MPPWSGSCWTARFRFWTPPPHVWLHWPKVPHCDTVQCTAHGGLESHASVCSRAGHAWPPCAAEMVTVRCLVIVPLPHVVSQLPKEPQSLTSQSTVHATALHACTSVNCGQVAPPQLDCTSTVRFRIVVPAPPSEEQLCVHSDHEDHWVTEQGTMGLGPSGGQPTHASVLQETSSVSAPQAFPPLAARVMIAR
jgi:hypothetical protein